MNRSLTGIQRCVAWQAPKEIDDGSERRRAQGELKAGEPADKVFMSLFQSPVCHAPDSGASSDWTDH